MPRPIIDELSTSSLDNPTALFKQLGTILRGLQRQLTGNTYVSSRNDSKTEQGLKTNDVVVRFVRSVLKVGVWDGKRTRFLNAEDLQSLQKHDTNYLGVKQGTALVTAAPTLALFPLQNDWGFYNRTAGPGTWFLVFNIDAANLVSVALI